MAYIIILILLQLTSMLHGANECNIGCNRKIALEKTPIRIIDDLKNETLLITKIDPYVNAKVLTRRLYKKVTHSSTQSISTSDFYDGPLLPDKIESIEWINKGKCQIGSICVPDGDCYGGGLDHCNGLGLNPSWVVSRKFSFRGSDWVNGGMFYKKGCVQDWECDINEVSLPIYYDEKGEAYFSSSNKKVYLTEKYYNMEGYVLYIDSLPKKYIVSSLSKCLTVNSNTFCTITDDKIEKSIWFKKDVSCLSAANYYICRHIPLKGEKTFLVDGYKGASLDDLNLLVMEVAERIGYQQYNNMILVEEINELKNVINKIVISSARFNNFILGDLLDLPLHSVKENGHLIVCPCSRPSSDCMNGEDFVSCEHGITNMTLFNKGLFLEDIELEQPDFRGVPTNVYEDIFENEYNNRMEWSNNRDHESTFFGLNGTLGFSMNAVTSFLPIINTFLIILILIRR